MQSEENKTLEVSTVHPKSSNWMNTFYVEHEHLISKGSVQHVRIMWMMLRSRTQFSLLRRFRLTTSSKSIGTHKALGKIAPTQYVLTLDELLRTIIWILLPSVSLYGSTIFCQLGSLVYNPAVTLRPRANNPSTFEFLLLTSTDWRHSGKFFEVTGISDVIGTGLNRIICLFQLKDKQRASLGQLRGSSLPTTRSILACDSGFG